jgi:predicted NACHT family NTPase
MRWLALQMSKASLSARHQLPEGLTNRQIPVLLHISDFAKRLTTNEDLTFEQFLQEWAKRQHTNLSTRLINELKQGHCLVLFDGLDEVASDDIRRKVARDIQSFIAQYTVKNARAKYYNRFVVTSRIVGYEVGPFSAYAHYTLLDLTDEQIADFLSAWCPAVERHMAQFAEKSKDLTTQQKKLVNQAGEDQLNRLLGALEHNPGVKRLAVNPLMLTILALVQRSGKVLPQRRIDLYRVVTHTLLDNWNQGSGRQMLTDVKLAEHTLSNLAYHLHSSDRLMTEREVKKIVRQSMAAHYEHSLEANEENTIDQFIETVRLSSGLFVESGQGLFSFMHRTFQEYYAAQYLLQHYLSLDELQKFVCEHFHLPIWHEPLSLAIAEKSGQDKPAATKLIQAIVNTQDSYDSVLRRNLLFATHCLVDCNAWSISTQLQQDIANQIFTLYGDNLGQGSYTALKRALEQETLLWLGGQPQADMSLPPGEQLCVMQHSQHASKVPYIC